MTLKSLVAFLNAYKIGNLQSIFSVPGFLTYLFISVTYRIGGRFKYWVCGNTSTSNVITSKFDPGKFNFGTVNVPYLSPFIYRSFCLIYTNYWI
jgi:hypothetical protein